MSLMGIILVAKMGLYPKVIFYLKNIHKDIFKYHGAM